MARAVDGRSSVARAIKGTLYDELREALTKPTGKGKTSWTQNYIQQMLKEAKENPNSPVGQLIARQLMTEDIIEKLDAETDKYLSRDQDFLEFRLMKTLYDKQRNVFLDNDRNKIVLGSRRIGKTELAARLLLKECIKPERHAVFISLKFENAIRQCYGIVMDLATSLGMPIDRASKNDGEIHFSNGSYILFKGNTNKAEASKLLGYKFSLVVIDEVQNQINLKYMLNEVLKPAMADYIDSALICLGTPPRIKGTVAEDIWLNYKGWKKYSWSMIDNPYMHDVEGIIKQICLEKGITAEAPFIQREYRGVMVYDQESMVYKDYKTYNGDVPSTFFPTDIAIGTDYGFSDYNSMIALAYNRDTKQAYVIQERKFNKATISEIVANAREIFDYSKKFAIERNNNFDFSKIMFYCDTNEQSITYELSTNYKLPVTNCYKHDKKMAISQLSDWCRCGRINVPEDGILVTEFEQTVYKRDEQDNITAEIDDDLFHPDACDALLYASRQYAYDCGEDSGGESTDKKEVEESRLSTLPSWMQN